MTADPDSFRETAGTSLMSAFLNDCRKKEVRELEKIIIVYEQRQKDEGERREAIRRASPRWQRFFYKLGDLVSEIYAGNSLPDFDKLEYYCAKNVLAEKRCVV